MVSLLVTYSSTSCCFPAWPLVNLERMLQGGIPRLRGAEIEAEFAAL